jgi:hypothetical protein
MGERVFLAVPAAVLYGVILYGLVWGVNWSDRAMLFIVGLLFVPMAIASLAVIISDPRGQICRARHAKIMVITVTICIAIALLVLGEGRICAAMAAPFLYLGGLIGTLVTPPLLRRLRTRWISGALVALPLLGLPIELQIAYPGSLQRSPDRHGNRRNAGSGLATYDRDPPHPARRAFLDVQPRNIGRSRAGKRQHGWQRPRSFTAIAMGNGRPVRGDHYAVGRKSPSGLGFSFQRSLDPTRGGVAYQGRQRLPSHKRG